MSTPAPSKPEIHVRGEVNLGNELTLERVSAVDARSARKGPRRVAPTSSPADRVRAPSYGGGSLEYLPESHELRPGRASLALKDDGLVLQYGIVGKPGCGKTHLLMHLLRQIIAHEARHPDRTYGGLILDPKSALIEEVREAFRRAGRKDDLVVISTAELRGTGGVNVIDCMLSPGGLAQTLVLAARSAGLGASDPFWLQQMATAFGALLTLMKLQDRRRRPTLARLMRLATGSNESGRPALDPYLKEAEISLKGRSEAEKAVSDFRTAVDELRAHAASGAASADARTRLTVEQFMQQAFRVFGQEDYQCYSSDTPTSRTLYDRILEEGKVVLVSVGADEVELTSLLPALVKLIFQRTVISRFARYRRGDLMTCERPLLFMADEYHTVATKVAGMFGDSDFFSLAREFGALCFVATQSLQQLVVSPLEDAWKAIFDVLSAVIVMSGNDPETKKYVDELAGKKVVTLRKRTRSISDGKETTSVADERLELPVIPVGTLQLLKQGEAIVIGKIGGQKEPATVRYVGVPPQTEG